MTAGTRLVTLPSGIGAQIRVNKADSILVYANTDADAIAMVKNQFDGDPDALWDSAVIVQPVVATVMTGWSIRVRIATAAGVLKANVTATAAAAVATAAFGTLTFAGQPLDTETVTLNGKVYTFQDTLTNVDGHVKIGADVATSIGNFVAAVTLAAGSGTKYAAATTAHATMTVQSSTATTIVFAALTAGSAGNALTTTETLTNGSFATVTLAQGADGATIDALGEELVTLLNASLGTDGAAHVTHAAYVASTHTLTAAGTADNLGDHTLLVEVFPPGSARASIVSFVGSITHQGSSGAALTVVLVAANPIPSIPVAVVATPFH